MHLNTFPYVHGEHKINSPIVADISSVLSRDHSIFKKERKNKKGKTILNAEIFRNINASSYIFKVLYAFFF